MKDWAIVGLTALTIIGSGIAGFVQMEGRIAAVEEARREAGRQALQDIRALEDRVLTLELTCCE